MVLIAVECPHCHSDYVGKGGKTSICCIDEAEKDEVFLRLKTLLEPFSITRYFTD